MVKTISRQCLIIVNFCDTCGGCIGVCAGIYSATCGEDCNPEMCNQTFFDIRYFYKQVM